MGAGDVKKFATRGFDWFDFPRIRLGSRGFGMLDAGSFCDGLVVVAATRWRDTPIRLSLL